MAKETELMRMNIVAISRVDPYVKSIVDTSAHVALYTFNAEANEWEKTDIEGALFIYARTAEPWHSIFINNRLNTNSLVEPITRFELQSQPPFLLYRNDRSKIRGFWFYSTTECDRIGALIKKLVKETQVKGGGGSGNGGGGVPMPLKNTNSNVNILSMLSKAQEDFNKVTTSVGPLVSGKETNNSATMQALNNPSVMSFFGAIPTDPVSLQRLKPSVVPPVHTVDEIEKKHRATTPQTETFNTFNGGLGNGKMKHIRGPSPDVQTNELGTSPLVNFFNSVNLGNTVGLNKKAFPIINAKAVSEIELEQTRPIVEKVNNNDTQKQNVLSAMSAKPALMPPTMFETTAATSSTESETVNGFAPLTKDQLVKAMSYLLKNDPGFAEKLHEAYWKSLAH